MKIACVAVVKDEEHYIAEWIAYQLALGFDTVVLLDNASADRTKLIAGGFSPLYDVRVLDWPMRISGFQLRAFEFAVRQADGEFAWMAFFDADEFLVLDEGPSLKQCLAALPDAAAVAVSWAMFGSSGHREAPAGLVTENYLHRAAADFKPNRHVKSIIRPELMKSTIHPHAFEMNGAYADLAGRPVIWDEPGLLPDTPDYAGGKLHHYFTRSWDDWLAKLRRGNPNRTRSEDEFYMYDRNEVFDDKAAALAPRVKEILAGLTRTPGRAERQARLKLGIAITTLNRKDMLLNLIKKIRDFAVSDYELVVCDDGSEDGTRTALAAEGIKVIGGTQRGIAWNKNRGIYFLLNVARCDVILLLDDDVIPVSPGWELEWIEAAWRCGHVNFSLLAFRSSVVSGACTGADLGLATTIPGCALAFSRIALAQLGYLDVRFGRYGHEHSDFSFRALRAGFGGIKIRDVDVNVPYFYVMSGGLEVLPAATSGTQDELEANGRLLGEVANDPIYRHAWLNDEMRDLFLSEIEEVLGHGDAPLRLKNHFQSWTDHRNKAGMFPGQPVMPYAGPANLALRKAATQSSVSEWSRRPGVEQDAVGAVNGIRDGLRKFHTALEDNPWWQVDLGGLTVIREIRIYNTTENTASRFRNFSLEVSIDGQARVELVRKEDDLVVGVIGNGPFIWDGPSTAFARFVRITLLGRDYLHLDQVEVYGTLV